ncbi:unnamed protein product [Protopolystoma xenopodis]|uniref:IFT121 second beta-propeller domain-containing protein n=1 Tax=Protopolystoma xenopodis TaxID=117903 RepID=A0A448WC50_9PLAT|nr:unnamed protein product [Protopolystoma xenopodis]
MAKLTDDADYDACETSGNVPRRQSDFENDYAYNGLWNRCIPLGLPTNMSKRLGMIDESGLFTLHRLTIGLGTLNSRISQPSQSADEDIVRTEDDKTSEAFSKFSRKDVWDIRFAEDNPRLFCIMDKTRLYIYEDLEAEPAVQTSIYICSFRDLEVKGVLLDDLVRHSQHPELDCLVVTSTKAIIAAFALYFNLSYA